MIRSSEDVIINISAKPKLFGANGSDIMNLNAIDHYQKATTSYDQRKKPISFCESERCLYGHKYKKREKTYLLHDFFGKGKIFVLTEINTKTKRCKKCDCEVIWSRKYTLLQ